MGYKMKGYSYPGKSPLKQEEKKKKVPSSDWNMDDYLVDGKPAKEVVKEHREKEMYKWLESIEEAKKKFKNIPVNDEGWQKAPNKKSPAKQKPKKSTESAHGQLSDAEWEYQNDLKAIKRENLDHIGTGFMNPPYKDTVKRQKQGVPYAKRQGYHGFKNFDSVIPQFQKNKK